MEQERGSSHGALNVNSRRNPESTSDHTSTQNSAETHATGEADIHGGARPKTTYPPSERTYKYRKKYEKQYEKPKRPKSSYDIHDKGSPKQNNTRDGMGLSLKTRGGSLDRTAGSHQSNQCSWKGRDRSRDSIKSPNTDENKMCIDSQHRNGNSSLPFRSARNVRQSWDDRTNTPDMYKRATKSSNPETRRRRNNHEVENQGNMSLCSSRVKRGQYNTSPPEVRQLTYEPEKENGKEKDKIVNKKRILGYPFLKSLVGRDPGYIILELTKAKPSLEECLNRTSKEWEFLELFLQVLSDAVTSTTTPNLMIGLYETLREVNFFDTVMLYLIDVLTMANGESKNIQQIETVLKNILNIIMEQITRNPSSFHLFGRIHTIIGQVVCTIMKSAPVDDEIVSKYEELTEEKKRLNISHHTNFKTKYDRKPPDDFRQCLVAPSSDEITGTVKPFLRPNKVDGRYDDLDHYLDVQFRLLKEDFVGPLREGMTEYIDRMTTTRSDKKKDSDMKKLDIKIYDNVRVHIPVITEHGLCYKLKLEMNKHLQQINWEFSKRLMYGSLVCLTDNEFRSFFLAAVVGRDEKDIKDGYLTVHFEQENVKTHDIHQKSFKMIESSAYFESYRHVLSSLQTFKTGDLPFEKYIVNCEAVIGRPAYLTEDCVYDLRPLTKDRYELQSERRLQNIGTRIRAPSSSCQFNITSMTAKSVKVCDPDEWPSKELLCLDESQYRAIQTALTKEFAIIQGPPGTGKTYIGLQIVKALLHNKSVWSSSGPGVRPLLVVCYTNHALDQFLEGIHHFFQGDILRVGGRSSSTVLKNCNLKHYRQLHHPVRSKYGQLQMTRKQALIALQEQSHRLQELAASIDIFFTDIISERFLRQEIGGARLFNSLVYGFKGRVKERKGFSYILKWLGIKYTQTICWQQVQQEAKTNKDQFVNVEDDTKQRARNMFVEGDEENRIYLEENAKTLLRKIRKETGSVFYVDQERCTMKNKNMSGKEWTEIKYYRRLKDTIERKISDPDIMTLEDAETVQDVWRLDHNAKWRLYRLWIQQLCLKQYEKIEAERSQFEETSERYREAVLQEEKEIMRQASVIGMTTSGAARYQSVLRDICPRIIIVEEAAEVLEAHIITTLSKGCEHLILIGDHKQLRPNPNVYKLATRYKLNISLFERMIKNGMSYNTLELQHRMRPEISSIVKHIYPDLQDHQHVKEYPPVKGVSGNLFLINHTHPETTDKELRSYSNMFEAQYVPALCRYLLQQGYGRRKITILTTYTGQLLCMRKFMPKEEFQGVKITVVDNYQGEENEIVILSLVRSNDIEKIGFLKTENRICVALSRAKVGFFILGNFNHLATHSSLWKKIVDEMKEKNKLGDGLPLYCQNHPRTQPVIASTYSDFRKAPEGGCSDICNIRLKCGHKCRKYCHILDMTHREYKCTQKCTKQLCELGHVCPDKCSATCGRCRIMVSKTMPICGHIQIMQCSVHPLKFSCREPCEKSLECGHRCMEKCVESHTSKCKKIVNHKWPCSHEAEIECWKTVMPNIDKLCPHPCAAILECEHVCGGTCGKCFSGRVHEPCQQDCKRILVCGHDCKASCSNCPPCRERCQNRCVHSICDKHCGELCTSCTERCSWECAHFSCTKLCHEPCDRPRCNEPCADSIQKCGHPCIGLCGEPCPNLCKICDKDEVTEILFGNEDEPDAKFVLLEDCNHIVESVGMDEYMDKEDGDYSIQLKTCPRCKTPIRKCLRYGTLINRTLADAERVKTEIIGDLTKKNVVKSKLNKATRGSIPWFSMRLQYTRTSSSIDSKLPVVSNILNGRLAALEASGFYSERQLATIENQYIIAEAIINVRHAIRLERISNTSGNEKELNMRSFLKELLQIILKDKNSLTEQEIKDFKREIERGRVWVKYLKIEKARRMLTCKEDPEKVSADKKKLIALVFETKLFTEDDREEANECIERLKTHIKVGSLGITNDERLEIVNAVGLRKGHWFKCPNNHIYAIGDCGGASEKSICPECKAEIGGVHHRLTEGNKLAPEMDGAPYAAYSEEANNMGNFDLNNLH